ncbi:MAG: DUF7225 domain-containing protein [Janthinobacterium lividum]
MNLDSPPLHNWPRMAQTVDEAAAGLHTQYGEKGIPSDVLKREIECIGGYGRDSVIPSDYCYNVINRAAYSFRHWVLVRVGWGRYKYVGPDDAFTGPILWKPKQEAERQVGRWSDGVCRLDFDPRV